MVDGSKHIHCWRTGLLNVVDFFLQKRIMAKCCIDMTDDDDDDVFMWPMRKLVEIGMQGNYPKKILEMSWSLRCSLYNRNIHVLSPGGENFVACHLSSLSPLTSCHIFTVGSKNRPKVTKQHTTKENWSSRKRNELLSVNWTVTNSKLSPKFCKQLFSWLTRKAFSQVNKHVALLHMEWEHYLTLIQITTSNAQGLFLNS